MKDNQATDLIYHEQFDNRKGNVIQVTDDFLDYLDREGSFKINGGFQDDLILSTDDKTYKLRGINLPTSMLIVSDKGSIELEVSHYLKLQDYNHQYHRIYQKIKQQAPNEKQFDQFQLQQLIQQFGIKESQIKQKFKISLKQFAKFEEYVNFFIIGDRRLFIHLNILYKFMQSLLRFLTDRQIYNQYFTLQDLIEFESPIKCFKGVNERFFNLVAKKFCFEIDNHSDVQKMQIQDSPAYMTKYKLTYESVIHFVIIELAFQKTQYTAGQMDQMLPKHLLIYVPTCMQTGSQQENKQLIKRVISRYFIETTKNNILLRVYYDPLEIESSLNGRIKFMSGFKSRFTRDQIRGVFEGLVIQDSYKQIKQLNQGGRKSIDMDDLLLKNFRRFNELYQIKLILPK